MANDDRFLDIDVGWPGGTHDSRVWARSDVELYIEEQRRFLIAGDSGYPISEVLIKPYSTAEAGNNRRKRIFNSKLSGLRTVMSENLFGIWKRRFPILKGLRTHFELSQKIVVATAILFNFGRMMNDEPPENDDGEDSDDNSDDEEYRNIRIEDGDGNTIRLRGQAERDKLCDNMR